MNKEIEVKAKVNDLAVIKAELEKRGYEFGEPLLQEDSIFTDYKGPFTDIPLGTTVLRLRKAKGKILFTLKQAQKNELDCIEKEVEVSDAPEMKAILETLGYRESVHVHKSRLKAKKDGIEVCLDEVQDLGSFIEVEKMSEGDADLVQEELFIFLESLGVQRDNRVARGYDTLIWLKNNKEVI